MEYGVQIESAARRSMKRMPREIHGRLVKAIRSLGAAPRPPGCVKMAGITDTYRIRVGDYRVIYEVKDTILVEIVVRIGHRSEIYRGT